MSNTGYAAIQPGKQIPKFYMTEQTAVVAGRDCECIGIGDYLGHYLIGRSGVSGMAVREALALSAYALAGIKDYVRECGGMSVYLLLHNDGRVGILTSEHDGPCSQLQHYAKAYDFNMRELLIALSNEDSKDSDFERYLADVFVPRMTEVRRGWTKARQQREATFRNSNPQLGEREASRIFRDLAIGLLPLPPSKP